MMRVDDSFSIRPREVATPGNGRPAREAGRVEEEDEHEADISTSVCGTMVAVLSSKGLQRGLKVVGIVAVWVWVSPFPRDGSILGALYKRCHQGLPPPLPPPYEGGTCVVSEGGAWGEHPYVVSWSDKEGNSEGGVSELIKGKRFERKHGQNKLAPGPPRATSPPPQLLPPISLGPRG